MKKKTKSKKTKSGKSTKRALVKNADTFSMISTQIPEKLKTVKMLREKGNQIIEEARELVAEAGENIPQGAKRTIRDTRRKVAAAFNANPKLATAAAAVVGVSAGIVAKRLMSPGKR